MATKEITTQVWTIEDHPLPDACYTWVRINWHDLGDHTLEEILDTAKKFSELLGFRLDYSTRKVI